MAKNKVKLNLSEEGKREQQKFFRLCSSSDRKKLTGKELMSVGDFERITFLLRHLGLTEYELYVEMNFEEQLFAYAERQEWLDEGDYSLGEWCEIERIEVTDKWIREFCEQIPHERTRRQYMKKYVWDGDIE